MHRCSAHLALARVHNSDGALWWPPQWQHSESGLFKGWLGSHSFYRNIWPIFNKRGKAECCETFLLTAWLSTLMHTNKDKERAADGCIYVLLAKTICDFLLFQWKHVFVFLNYRNAKLIKSIKCWPQTSGYGITGDSPTCWSCPRFTKNRIQHFHSCVTVGTFSDWGHDGSRWPSWDDV